MARNPRTPLENENYVTGLAMDEAIKRIKNGTATSQLLSIFCKPAMQQETLKLRIQEKTLELMDAKIKALESESNIELLFANFENAMSIYRGDFDE